MTRGCEVIDAREFATVEREEAGCQAGPARTPGKTVRQERWRECFCSFRCQSHFVGYCFSFGAILPVSLDQILPSAILKAEHL